MRSLFLCVHMQILILYRNRLFLVTNILMLKRKSAKNIKDEAEVHKLFPLLTSGKRCGCAAAMVAHSSELPTESVLEPPRITSPAPCHSCSAEQTSQAAARSAEDPYPRKDVNPCYRVNVTCCSRQKGTGNLASCQGGPLLHGSSGS